ncbi:MAG: hypothetical protein K2Q24_14990 [Chitinophagaceae bacterium]|jgi:hypothetical protein|nr:hypothetical protein [Chitinophagaceae bacterium]
MKNLVIFGCLLLASCTKTAIDQQVPAAKMNEQQRCDFGMTSFNLTKRPAVEQFSHEALRRRPGGNGGTTTTPPPPGVPVLYLDFDGEVVSGTAWNSSGDINCAPANLTADAIQQIIQRVSNDFSPFNVLITTDAAVYNSSTAKRTKVIITESWEWYGQAGGVAYQGTFAPGSTTPCFVFSSLLNYSTKAVAEAISHESGHTIGLYHQSSYDANGVKTAEYNSGVGTGEIAWAPIMGNSYGRNLSLWHKGSSNVSATYIQDDVAIIQSAVGSKTDDFSNGITGAAVLTATADAVINNATDVDYFSVTAAANQTISVTPFNTGISHAGSNVDLVLKVYNAQGVLLSSINDGPVLNASVALSAGSYYISVSAGSNANTTTHGMLGKYKISLQ